MLTDTSTAATTIGVTGSTGATESIAGIAELIGVTTYGVIETAAITVDPIGTEIATEIAIGPVAGNG